VNLTSTEGDTPPVAITTPRLLLCDDSPIERMALAMLLRREGYAVDETGDGVSTIAFLQNRPVNLLLLDLEMDRGDGFSVLSYLQQHNRGLPVILLTGLPADEIQHRMHTLPTQELPPLFLKPIDIDRLLEVMDMQLSGELSADGAPTAESSDQ
jgi:CheY-like chemotaxis protein